MSLRFTEEMKDRLLLENYDSSGALEAKIGELAE